jgi:hypothetical protein
VLSLVIPRSPASTLRSFKVVADAGRAPLATPSTVETPVIVTDDVATLTTDAKTGS